jgi:excisionase family DNA binding protein
MVAAKYPGGSQWLSIRDVADTLRVKEETVRRWIRRGELPVIDLGSARAGYRIHPSDLEQFINDRYMKP